MSIISILPRSVTIIKKMGQPFSIDLDTLGHLAQ